MKKAIKCSILLGLSILLFYNFWIFGKIPFPGDYLIAWYEPWKSTTQKENGTLGIPHKPVLDDVFRQLYPYKVLASDMIKKGAVPLWNPYNGSGTPLLAVMHAGFLTPLIALFLIFPYPIAWGLYIALQPILVAFFVFLYCRKIGFSTVSSLFSVSVIILSGFFTARYEFGEYIYVASCLPLLLYCLEVYRENEKSRLRFLFPVLIAFMVFSGQPQMIAYVGITTIIYACFRLKIKLFSLVPLCLLGLGLAAVQFLPTLELYQYSNMTTSSSQFIFERFLIPVSHLITLGIPNYFGNPSTYNYWGYADYIETVCSIGLIPLFFGFYAFFIHRRESLIKFWVILFGVSIVSTLNIPIIRDIYKIGIPIISTGIPTRIYFITTFALAIVAGFGFDVWITNGLFKKNQRFFVSIPIILVCIIVFYTFVQYFIHAPCPPLESQCRMVSLRNTCIELLALVLCIVVCLLENFNRKKNKLKIIYPMVIVGIVLIMGIYNAQKFLPFTSISRVMPKSPVIDEILSQKYFGRVVGIDEAFIKTDFSTYYKYFDPAQYDPLSIKRYAEFVSYGNTGIYPPFLKRSDIEIQMSPNMSSISAFQRDRLLDILSVTTVLSKKNTVWENIKRVSAFPHAYIVSNYEVLQKEADLLRRFFDPSFDPFISVLLEKPITEKFSDCHNNDFVMVKRYEENNVIIESTTGCQKILVLTDTYYPGWYAFIDGKQTEILRANYTFRGIVLPAGNHTVQFLYKPISFKIGLLISGFSLVLLFGIIILEYKRK